MPIHELALDALYRKKSYSGSIYEEGFVFRAVWIEKNKAFLSIRSLIPRLTFFCLSFCVTTMKGISVVLPNLAQLRPFDLAGIRPEVANLILVKFPLHESKS